MKNKKIILGITILALLVGLVVFAILFAPKSGEQPTAQSNAEDQLASQLDKACSVFTLEKAKTLLGPNAVAAKQSVSPESFSDDIAASQCIYTDQEYDDSIPPESRKLASLIVRSPRTDAGRQANESVFSEGTLPKGAIATSGYGDKSFWNEQYGQLNIFKGGEWYILDYGSLLPESRSLGDSEKFADIINENL